MEPDWDGASVSHTGSVPSEAQMTATEEFERFYAGAYAPLVRQLFAIVGDLGEAETCAPGGDRPRPERHLAHGRRTGQAADPAEPRYRSRIRRMTMLAPTIHSGADPHRNP